MQRKLTSCEVIGPLHAVTRYSIGGNGGERAVPITKSQSHGCDEAVIVVKGRSHPNVEDYY